MKEKGLIVKFLLWIVGIVILYVLSFFTKKKGLNNFTQEYIFYKQDSAIDYKVYLKENNFFDTPYLGKDKIYITTLIDHIDVDYNYKINFDKPMSGFYRYYVKAIVSADKDKDSSGNYWQKEYKLYESELTEYIDKNYIAFNSDTIKLDYDYFNDILVKFKNSYKLSMYGNLKLVIEVENIANSELENKYEVNSVATLDIPLTQATIEIPIKSDTNNKFGTAESSITYDTNPIYLIMKIASGVTFLCATTFLFILVTKIVRSREKPSAYNKTVRKILKTYDEIIVNINNINLSEFNVVDVNEFNELIDAHGEVRQPINFMETRNDASFILINDKMAWRYRIKKGKTL